MIALLALWGLLGGPALASGPAAFPEMHPCRNGHCALSGYGAGVAYYDNIMEATAAYNLRHGVLTRLRYDVDGWASLPNCDTIGRTFTARIRLPGQPWHPWHRYEQVDCSKFGKDWNTHTAHGTRAWFEIGGKEAHRLQVYGMGQFQSEIRLGGTP